MPPPAVNKAGEHRARDTFGLVTLGFPEWSLAHNRLPS